MKDFAKTYFASLVCSHPDGKAQAKRVRLCVIKISCTRSAAWSLRPLRSLRENIKERLVHFEQIHILRVTSIYRTVIEDFRLLQQQHRQSGKSLKKFLIDACISYSNYRYWNKKFNTENTPQPLAPITFRTSIKNAFLSPPLTGDVRSGVTLLFPNGLKAHFGV